MRGLSGWAGGFRNGPTERGGGVRESAPESTTDFTEDTDGEDCSRRESRRFVVRRIVLVRDGLG